VLEGRRVVLGVSGGIAAYKAIEVCRRLVDQGAHVVPVMTRGATRFVGETTFSALASEPVHRSLFDDVDPIPHTRLGQAADVVVVAPATARVIGAYAAGISNDLLTATLLATEAPVVVCPAMHTEMWRHPAVQDNIATLARRGVHIVGPEEGRLAGGDTGEGRLASPDAIVAGVEAALGATRDLAGLHVVVTAGGTREPIDPVRFVGNRSSGKQGHALADEAAARGAKVTLVTTVALPLPAGVDVVRVETAAQMDEAVRAVASGADVVVMAAAVADFRPRRVADTKLARADGLTLELEPTSDILAEAATLARAESDDPQGRPLIVGFAAETGSLERAEQKAVRKGVDLLVANDVSEPGSGFGTDTNRVTIIEPGRAPEPWPLAGKSQVAHDLLDRLLALRAAAGASLMA